MSQLLEGLQRGQGAAAIDGGGGALKPLAQVGRQARGQQGRRRVEKAHVAPRALVWFRWAAVATWVTGAALLGKNFAPAFTLQPGHLAIGIGAWLGTIMLINVWGLLWPAQKLALGLAEATETQRNAARRRALVVSRLNLVLSFPLLFFMGAAGHSAIYF